MEKFVVILKREVQLMVEAKSADEAYLAADLLMEESEEFTNEDWINLSAVNDTGWTWVLHKAETIGEVKATYFVNTKGKLEKCP